MPKDGRLGAGPGRVKGGVKEREKPHNKSYRRDMENGGDLGGKKKRRQERM